MRGTYEAANSAPEETRFAFATFVVKSATIAACRTNGTACPSITT
jgi:hypothetical protein